MPGSLPDFVLIGATGSASDWLLQTLQAHPSILMPDPELHYFSREFARGEAWYRAQFTGADGRLIGESSTSYLAHPEAPARLHALLPGARLVAQLRNPIGRACSDYGMDVRREQVERTSVARLLEDGLYFRHLSAFLKLFPSGQLKVILEDDIRRDPGSVYRAVCAHIGVEPEADAALSCHGTSGEAATVLPRMLASLEDAVEPLRGHPAFRFARSLIARRLDDRELRPLLWQQLRDYYRADVEALEDLLERDLGHWLIEPARQARSR